MIAKNVAVATETIYLNSKTGFVGWGLKSSGGQLIAALVWMI